MKCPVILLEFKEITPVLMDRFIGEGILPKFARLRDEAIVSTTDAGAEPPDLEPWVQWVTVHTGVSHLEHGVRRLNEGAMLRMPRVWDLVSEAGKDIWVCGSMNAATRSRC